MNLPRACLILVLAAVAAGAAEPIQPVLLPQVELIRRLGTMQDWLFLPVAQWRELSAAATHQQTMTRAGTGLADGRVDIVCTPTGCSASATLTAIVDAGVAAAIQLFAEEPTRLDALTVAGSPGLAIGGPGLAVLLPGSGRWPLTARWSQPAPADAEAGWSVSLPLPLAAALNVTITAPADWELDGPGLVVDGVGRWRLVEPRRRLDFDLHPAGSRTRAWGASQVLTVQLPAVGAGGTFSWGLGQVEGGVPERVHLRLPPGFTVTTGGEAQADGSILIPVADLRDRTDLPISGIVAAAAAIDLPTLDGARWQGGVVDVAIAGSALLPTPDGWLPLREGPLREGPLLDGAARHYAVTAPGRALIPVAPGAVSGIDVRSSAAVAVGDGSVRATWGIELRPLAAVHGLTITVPAGWRVLAVDAGAPVADLPPDDEVLTQPWPLSIALGTALAPGSLRTVVLTLERVAQDVVPLAAPEVVDAVRRSARVLIAADPATEVTVAPTGAAWRLGPPVSPEAGLDPVAELLSTGEAPPLQLSVRRRPVRLEVEAACWLQPRSEDCLVRLDLRLAAAGGALSALRLTLPETISDGWTVEAGGAQLEADGLSWPAMWTGQRLVRLSARMALTDGRVAAVRPRLQLDGADVPVRLSVAVLAGERVDVTARPAGRALEPDELPSWSAPPPGTRVLAAWRPTDTDAGGATAVIPQLHTGPPGFLDQVVLRTQLAPGGGITQLDARLAAPGLAALPLCLPPGMRLTAALVDGETAAVRQDAADGCAVVLPGRTQVQLSLRFAHAASPGAFALDPPGIALPWLSTDWTVAVATGWRVESLDHPGAMPLTAEKPLPRRRLFGSWSPAAANSNAAYDEEIPPVRVVITVATPVDPRLLGGAPVLPPRRTGPDVPRLYMFGTRLHGQRIGSPSGLRLQLDRVAGLVALDRVGRLLGLVVGLTLITLAALGRLSAWRCVAIAAAAACGAAGLLAAQVAVGPLLGLCEALLVLAPLAVLATGWRRISRLATALPVLLLLAGTLSAQDDNVVLMGYANIGADGLPQGVTVALTRERFAALVAAAKPGATTEIPPALAIGPGVWTGSLQDDRWTFHGSVPVAAPGTAWGELRLPMPGVVESVRLLPLAGGAQPPVPAWRLEDGVLVLALAPQAQGVIELTATRAAKHGTPVDVAFPPGGTLTLTPTAGMVAMLAGLPVTEPQGLPLASTPLSLAVERPAAAVDSGSLGLEQTVTLRHLGDRIAWSASVMIDSQRQPPGQVALSLPARLEVQAVRGDGLVNWRQRDGVLELRWSQQARARGRSVAIDGVILGDGAVQPALSLPGAVRGGGQVAVVDAGPVRWSMPADLAGAHRVQPQEGERFRLAWDGAAPLALAVPYAAVAAQLSAAADGLLVAGPGRWRADVVFTLTGAGLADHVRIAVPSPWQVVAVDGATWLPEADGGALRAESVLAAGSRLVLHCEAAQGVSGLPPIAVAAGPVQAGRVRWLVAERGPVRATLNGPSADAEAVAADLARAGIRPRPGERLRNAIELRSGAPADLTVGTVESRQRLEAAHYLIAGAGAVRWACHLTVRPEQGSLDRLRIHLPPGARLIDRRGEPVAAWTEADGWLTARFAAPLDRPAAIDLLFTADWAESGGRDRVELGSFACEPALDRESVVLAEDEEAGQLLRQPDGLEPRDPASVPLPVGVTPSLLAGRAWSATGTAWKLALERERLDQGLGVDAVATLVDVRSAIDPDRRLTSRATWYVINRSRSALDLTLPDGCSLWEVRVGGQPVRARVAADGRISVPVTPLRPGEAATRIQVCWAQQAGDGLRPLLPSFPELRVMRALWRFTAPPGMHLRHVNGWDPVPAGDATGARVEVLADELKRLRSSSEESPAVRLRLADQLRLIDQELTDHVAVLEQLGQNTSRWTGDVALQLQLQQTDVREQQLYLQRNSSFNVVANDNRQQVKEKLGKLTSVAKAQRERRGGLQLESLAVRWPRLPGDVDAGPDWAPRRALQAAVGTPERDVIGAGLGAGGGGRSATATSALTGVDLLPVQDGEELTLRADNLGVQPVLALTADGAGLAWQVWALLSAAALALGVALSRRR